MKVFALKNKETGGLMAISGSSYDTGFSRVDWMLEDLNPAELTQAIWVTFRKDIAEKAAITDGRGWKNGESTPQNSYVGKLEVVEIEIN